METTGCLIHRTVRGRLPRVPSRTRGFSTAATHKDLSGAIGGRTHPDLRAEAACSRDCQRTTVRTAISEFGTLSRFRWIPRIKTRFAPVVLKENVKNVGRTGQVVFVKRGYARHYLVPNELAVWGTWENIDEHADPQYMHEAVQLGYSLDQQQKHSFDWVHDIKLQFVLKTHDTKLNELIEPLTVWQILDALSTQHELDLLPSNIDFPDRDKWKGLNTVGTHDVSIRIPFRTHTGAYAISVEIVSDQERRRAIERQKAMEAELARRPDFTLSRRTMEIVEEDEGEEDEGEGEGQEANDEQVRFEMEGNDGGEAGRGEQEPGVTASDAKDVFRKRV
ncbi:unnamed protein product [Vitrella brassicaformis CCMP3155]|uniref:Ribosomal protein L9 domain-containing protein n=1 Tax=Vitrella brassicaformis (strain CCMP3155) TaxID=1169540 RepID=A0A0G4FBY0_VITBC|nr:unnamed protein product [Vitrella brassicaformis CCMP3155]|mmetsp:Transcript_45699/g.129032  ORF Transcript_45699/g.129032 Transcript_45699/m.129032 type:complete len:335 (-) Transcript_45699:394-1398(-)|eukprot:CEM10755.1 unnamed protein product [Vitrella brassicaformis CCMP3155]